MKFRLLVIIAVIFVNACQSPNNHEKSNFEKPNVILIVVDDLGWKDLGFMGSTYYETPNIDKLASEGSIFRNAYSTASNCAPSRASMISGLYSPRHHVYTVSPSARGNSKTRRIIPTKNTKHLTDDAYTIADMFKDEGYITASFGKWHIGKEPKNQGIDINVGGSGRGNPGKDGYFSPYKIDNIVDGPDGEYLTDRLTKEAVKFLNSHQDTSFFLYLPYYTVHTPLMGKSELIKKFENKAKTPGQSNATYAAMVSSLDSNVGKLLSSLEEHKLSQNTIVIFTSDNGGIRAISSQEPLRAGKGSYYEGGIRVPLVFRWPGHIQSGTEVLERVSNLDFFPTLRSLIKASKTEIQLDGTDITPLLYGEEIEKRNLFWHFPIYLQAYSKEKDDGRDPLFRTRPGSVIISENWKLHEYFEDGTLELYNLKDDPGERRNLADTHSSKTDSLHQLLVDWRTEMEAPLPSELNPDFDSDFEANMISKVNVIR